MESDPIVVKLIKEAHDRRLIRPTTVGSAQDLSVYSTRWVTAKNIYGDVYHYKLPHIESTKNKRR